jgi:glycosyltransferase involved in cell wall biosynthesis
MPKIYLTAYNCSPGRGSEHSSGWNFIYNISKYVPITVITDEQFQSDFDLNDPLLKNIKMVFIKNPFDVRFLNSAEFPIGLYITYRYWEKEVYKYLNAQFKLGNVDLINRINLGSTKEPGYSWKVNVPYVWGEAHLPSRVPYRFFGLFSFKTKIIFFLLNLSRLKLLYLDRRNKAAFKKAFYVFATNLKTKKLFEKHFNKDCGLCYETGLNEKNLLELNERKHNEPLRIFWAGRIADFKGLELVIRAISKLPSTKDYELTVAGDGNQKLAMLELSKKLNVNVKFVGMIPYHQMSELFTKSHCYILTSFKDGLPNTIVEAISNFCPVICLDHLSYGEVIDSRVGLKVPVTNIAQIITDLAQKIQYLFDHETERIQLIKNMKELAHDLSWDQYARKVVRIYEKALGLKILEQ